MPFNSTRLKIVASRAAGDTHFFERACREEHHCSKSDSKTNILTSFLHFWTLCGISLTFSCIVTNRLTIVTVREKCAEEVAER
jgi:hypothetical protein